MGRGFIPGLTVTEKTMIRRRRELPLAGTVSVTMGQQVSADDIVARAMLPGELRIVRVAQALGIEPNDVMQGLKVKIGDSVTTGQLLCEHQGLFGLIRSRCPSPTSGTVETITEGTGNIGVRKSAVPLDLAAYISGEVVEVQEGRGVVIQTTATFVQGIFGVGGEKRGKLRLLEVSPDTSIDEVDIPSQCHGEILVGGCSPTSKALKAAMSRGAVGFVCGSIDDTALKEFLGYDLGMALTGDEPLSMTLIITEGFGNLAISERVLTFLGSRNAASCSINGATQVRAGAIRPEIIVPFEGMSGAILPSKSNDSDGELRISTPVRIIRVPYFGKIGTVRELPHDLTPIATGAFTRVVRVQLIDGSLVTVPRANVERV